MSDVNRLMLENVVRSIDSVSNSLQQVVLYEGAKYYGAYLGEFSTPAHEDDPRHIPPNFYYSLEDWLVSYSNTKAWVVTVLRPDLICGFSLGNPMNISMLIAVYATISKELGIPLRFPGSSICYSKLAQVTDATLLAKASVWATGQTSNYEYYNVTNGDLFRWNQLFPKIANYFEMDIAPPQTISLVEKMVDKGELWQEIIQKYQLQNIPYQNLVSWAFGDFIFRCDWDVISSTTKNRQAGFHEVEDSSAMFM